MKENITLTFHGGVGTVTGANFLFEIGNKKVLVDCGLLQGDKFATVENRKPFPYDPASIDYLFVTHAHLDHVGRIPKLVKDGFKGIIYSTPETKSLAELILGDAVKLLAGEASHEGVLPLYEPEHIQEALQLWNEIPYHTPTPIDTFEVYLYDAGHILGSSMFEFRVGGKKVMFTGDLGNSPTPLLKDTEKIEGLDYLVMESVYGDRNHEPAQERREKLKKIIKESFARGGALIIPAFSLERTQVLLYEINSLVEKAEIPIMPVFVDSPLATKITQIYKRSKHYFNDKVQEEIQGGDDIFNFPRLRFTVSSMESRAIERTPNPKIIIAGSGMSNGGRVISHEAHYLPDHKNTLLLVGYQSLGTLGRQLQDGAKEIIIHDQKVKVSARIENIWGYSSHKDSDHLIDFVSGSASTLKKVFCVMGEPKASLFLVQRLRDYLGVEAIYPSKDQSFKLD